MHGRGLVECVFAFACERRFCDEATVIVFGEEIVVKGYVICQSVVLCRDHENHHDLWDNFNGECFRGVIPQSNK